MFRLNDLPFFQAEWVLHNDLLVRSNTPAYNDKDTLVYFHNDNQVTKKNTLPLGTIPSKPHTRQW